PNPQFGNYLVLFTEPLTPEREAVAHILGSGFLSTPAAIPQLANSLIVAGAATALAVIVGSLAAFSLSRYRTGGLFLYIFILMTRMFPPLAIAVPLLVMWHQLGALDTHMGLVATYLGVSVAFVVWMMKTFFDEVPREVEEAAVLDGLSETQAFFRIILPLVRSGLVAAALFTFIINWGEFGFALLFTQSVALTVPPSFLHYMAGGGFLYAPMTALGVVAVIPVVVFGYIIQKHLVRGLSFGALKGAR
ncbi:MAG: carbohydrate ABC transporter permease, partial [Candidatus Bathyarchaeia archaeon]